MGEKVRQESKEVRRILDGYQHDESLLVSILQDVQAEYRYLPREALEQVGNELGIPLSRVYSVATFFKAFSLKPRGEHLVTVCLGTACHVRGAPSLLDEVKRHLLGKDIYLDTSFFFDFLPKKEVKNLLLSHRPDRLLFGTDFPLVDQKKDLEFLRKLDLPASLKERILSLNAKELLSIQ